MKIVSLLMIGLLVVSIAFMGNVTPTERVKAIVVFKDKVQDSDVKALSEQGGIVKNRLNIINGVSVELPKVAFDKIYNAAKHGQAGYEKIKYIEVDQQVQALKAEASKGKPTPSPVPQETPWGITEVNAPQAWAMGIRGSGIKVAVIDSGIDYTHPDLAGKVIGGYNFVRNSANYMDDNGHGTHCAGIIAANDNSIGVVGVAPEASLFAVKVLDRRGSGYVSDVVSGIEWAVTNEADVISMSLGVNVDVQSFHDAVDAAYSNGIVIVAAAGNEGGAVSYPAAYDTVIAVSAVDVNLIKASWSNFGPEVDLAAPGVSVYSTYKGGYEYLSGTSMACPHVSGVAALVLTTAPGNYDTDHDDTWDPAEVMDKLTNTAQDLGNKGWDNYYGNGLVDVSKAVT